MATSPTYNPNLVEHHFDRIANTKAPCFSAAAPLVNRATTGLYQPGSTFKLVTAAAALDSGTFTPESRFNDPGYCVEYGKPVLQLRRPERARAIRQRLARRGPPALDQLGLLQRRESSSARRRSSSTRRSSASTRHAGLETPADEQSASGLYDNGPALLPAAQLPGRPRPARLRAGAPRRDAAADGDGRGRRSATAASSCSPTSSTGSSSPEEECCTTTKPKRRGRAISPQTAAELTTMMESVVTGGTGTALRSRGCGWQARRVQRRRASRA